ncbi:MAG TPA: hypothetical protein VD861_11395 [Pyrinomonadaceae bacterium]|nr:hypothetical protein [Pyrinomonadaceae bacterium]
MHTTHNPVRFFAFRAVGLLALAVTLLSSSTLAQTSDSRRDYRMASGAVGVTRSQSVNIYLVPKKKWFPLCDITPGNYVGTVEMTLASAEGRELARVTRRIEGCMIATMSVNVDDILRGEGRMAVRAVVRLIESGELDGTPPALAASIEVSDNVTGKATVLQSFADPSPSPWVLIEQ